MHILFLFISFALSPSFADWTKVPSQAFTVPPPPTRGSAEDEKDFEILLDWQTHRDPADCQLSAKQLNPDFNGFYERSGLLSPNELKRLRPSMQKVIFMTERVSEYFKNRYQRPRPYSADPRIQPCIPRPGGSKSYPSSHAAAAEASACLLSQIFPSRSQELLAYGTYLGDLRFRVGVHHPSDVRAGQDLGEQVCHKLWSDADFRAEVDPLGDPTSAASNEIKFLVF